MNREVIVAAEKMTSEDLGLDVNEVRGFVYHTALPAERKKLRSVDWMEVDLLARRAIKKICKAKDVCARDAREIFNDSFMRNYKMCLRLADGEEEE